MTGQWLSLHVYKGCFRILLLDFTIDLKYDSLMVENGKTFVLNICVFCVESIYKAQKSKTEILPIVLF